MLPEINTDFLTMRNMKKLLLSIIAVAGLAFSSNAQTEQGKWVLGGAVSFTSEKAEGADKANTEFSIIPSVGYFVANDISVGVGVGYTSSKDIGFEKTSAFIVSPFGRYYKSIGESGQFKFFGQVSVPMAFGKVEDVDADGNVGDEQGKTTVIGVNLAPGFAFFPSKRVAIEFSLNGLTYANQSAEDADGNDLGGSDTFSFDTNFFTPRVGIQFHF